jgi:hypothetical protein
MISVVLSLLKITPRKCKFSWWSLQLTLFMQFGVNWTESIELTKGRRNWGGAGGAAAPVALYQEGQGGKGALSI